MRYYYSKTTSSFYVDRIHGENIPADAVEITEAEHASLMQGQSEGKTIQADADGKPQAVGRTYTLEEVKARKLSELAAYRYGKETAGVSIGGMIVKTDRESQSMLAGAKIYSDMNEDILVDWKAESGWVKIDRATILAMSQAVAAHIQACFSREKIHGEAIEALATIEDIETYDFTAGWPV